MKANRKTDRATEFVIVWEFRPGTGKHRKFGKAYSPHGLWAEFFSKAKGYIRTELLRDREDPLRYFTVDVWQSRQAYERFKKQHRDEYQSIDQQCEPLTAFEKKVGEFQSIGIK